MSDPCAIDSAGAFVGGAARFLLELDLWSADDNGPAPVVIGRGRSLTAPWMAQREFRVPSTARRIALNNVSFQRTGGPRVVLLRNALHFCDPAEMQSLHFEPSRALRAQIPIVRFTAARADEVIVPCTAMAERVHSFVPDIGDRLVVRHHPVTPRPWNQEPPQGSILLIPIISSPYKRLSWHMENILQALDALDSDVVSEVRVTAEPGELPAKVAADERVTYLGHLSAEQLDQHYEEAAAVYFPTQLESFGYPLAEARANGRRVVALDTSQNHEIAGRALAGFSLGDLDSLSGAIQQAVTNPVAADPQPFDPGEYFRKLLARD